MTAPLLAIRGLRAAYGKIEALKGIDLDINAGEIVALIGANGAGKSTLMMTIFGNPRAREGQIIFAGRVITQLPTHEIARLKIAQAGEQRQHAIEIGGEMLRRRHDGAHLKIFQHGHAREDAPAFR